MAEHASKREMVRAKFQIALHGGKVEDEPAKQEGGGWFKDPAEYEHLSQREREELTEKMMAKHQAAATDLVMRRP